MEITRDPSLERAATDYMRVRQGELSNMMGTRDTAHLHLTGLIHCLTAEYDNQKQPLSFSDQSLFYMLIGQGLEFALVPVDKRLFPGIHEGIAFSPDLLLMDGLTELKSTRTTEKKIAAGELPGFWRPQILGYAKAHGVLKVNLLAMFVIPATLRGYRISFTQEEVDDNWQMIRLRETVLRQHLLQGIRPAPYVWNADASPDSWECNNCPYSLRCRSITTLTVPGAKWLPTKNTILEEAN